MPKGPEATSKRDITKFHPIKVKYIGTVVGGPGEDRDGERTARFMISDVHGNPCSFDPGQVKTVLVDESLEKEIEANTKDFEIVDKEPKVGETQHVRQGGEPKL